MVAGADHLEVLREMVRLGLQQGVAKSNRGNKWGNKIEFLRSCLIEINNL